MNFEIVYHKDFRFGAIKDSLEKEFARQGYSKNDKFDFKIWFLHNDIMLNSYILDVRNNEAVLLQYINKSLVLSTLFRIILSSAQYKEKGKKGNLSELITMLQNSRFFVCDFIFKFSEILLHSQFLVESCEETIENNSIIKTKDIIDKELGKVLNEDVLERKSKEKAKISFSLVELMNFPEGEYNFKLVLTELDSNYNLVRYERSMESSKKIKIIDSIETLNLKALNLQQADLTFHELFVHQIDQNELLSKVKDLDSIFLKIPIKEVQDDTIFGERGASRKGTKSKTILNMDNLKVKSILNLADFEDSHEEEEDLDWKVKANQNQRLSRTKISAPNYKYIPIDFNFEENSGTCLFSFGILIEKDGVRFGEAEDLFIDYCVSLIRNIVESKSKEIESIYSSTIVTEESTLLSSETDRSQFGIKRPKIVFGINFNYNDEIQRSILNRISQLYSKILESHHSHKELIDTCLKNHFPRVREDLIRILNSKCKEDFEICCKSGCHIF